MSNFVSAIILLSLLSGCAHFGETCAEWEYTGQTTYIPTLIGGQLIMLPDTNDFHCKRWIKKSES